MSSAFQSGSNQQENNRPNRLELQNGNTGAVGRMIQIDDSYSHSEQVIGLTPEGATPASNGLSPAAFGKIGMQPNLVSTTQGGLRVESTGNGATGDSIFDASHDLTQQEIFKFRDMNEDRGGEDNDTFGQNLSGLSTEYKELGILAQMNKGTTLIGQAYNGYDTNIDFKVKNQFKSPSVFKTVHDARTYFFTRLLEMMFRQLEQRTSKNTSFNLIYIFFHFTYQHNVYLSINTLVKLSRKLRNSLFQRMTFAVSEYYILELILTEFKRNTKNEVDYTSFIKSNQMSQRLDWLFEDAASDIVQFWSVFKDENANVRRAYELGMQISENIKMIREYTKTLEEKELIKDYNKYYYYAMFYQNLLNDKQQYNQMVTNLKNLIMVRNMRKKNTRLGVSSTDIIDLAFAILSYEDDKTVGKFKYCNNVACQLLGTSEDVIIGESVVNIMPELVRMNHELFIKRFQQEGMPRIFGKVRNIHIKDFNDYIIPVQFFLNFHYSCQFGYSLILHLDPIQSITYYGCSTVIPIKYCIFIICDAYNVIMNFTQNARKLLGFSHKVKKEQEEIIGRQLKMEDIVQNWLRVENIIEQNEMKYLPNQIMRVRNFKSGPYDDQYTHCSITFQEMEYLKNCPGQFSERIYCINPLYKVPEIEAQVQLPGTLTPGLNNSGQSNSKVSGQNEPSHDAPMDSDNSQAQQDEDQALGLSVSMSSMSSTSSRGSTSSTMQNTKTLLFSQRSPRILKLYLYIVFGVFFSFIIVSSINFIIYMQKKASVDLKIQFNQIVNKRNTYLSSTILTIKQLHMISVYPSLNSSRNSTSNNWGRSTLFSMDRFILYSNELVKNLDGLQDYHNKFKQKDQLYGADLGTDRQQFDAFKSLNLTMVSENGRKYSQKNTLDFGLSLFITNLGMVNSSRMIVENIPLNIYQAVERLESSNNVPNATKRQVTSLFRSLFYLYDNGMASLNALGLLQESLIQANTIQTSDESKLFVNLISFISIGVITLIGIFTFPLLGKIEDRKISVLKFFNMLNIEQITELVQRGKDFQVEFEAINGQYKASAQRERLEEAEDEDRVQLSAPDDIAPQDETNKQHKKILANPQKGAQIGIKKSTTEADRSTLGTQQLQKSSLDGLLGRTGSAQDIANIIKRIRLNDYNRDKREYLKRKNKEYEKNKQMMNLSGQVEEETKEEKVVPETKKGGARKDKKLKTVARKGASKIKGSSANIKEKKGSGAKGKYEVRIEDTEKGETGSDEEDPKKRKKGESSEEDDEAAEEKKKRKNLKEIARFDIKSQALQAAITSRTEQIGLQVEKIALGEKLKLACYVLVVLVFLNSCLFICFYLGQKTFQDDAKTLSDLSTFYHRENCLDNLMLYTLEQYVQNKTISLDNKATNATFDPSFQNAANYYMDSCQSTEQEYNDLRRNLPSFLQGVSTQIDNLESSNLCKQTYASREQIEKRRECERVYDEILKRGLTSTMYTIFNFAQQLSVRFEKQEAARNSKFLEERLFDPKVRDMIDLITYFMHDALFYMDNLITQNALDYFEQLASYYMIIYITYMVVSVIMALIFGLVIFQKLKQQIMTSANILAIMPLEELDQRDRHKIEQFLNS